MSTLLNLCPELLQGILEWVQPEDLATLCACCRTLHDFIHGNKLLFKELYLDCFVSPCDSDIGYAKFLTKLLRMTLPKPMLKMNRTGKVT